MRFRSALVVLVLLTAACGSGDEGDEAAASSPSSVDIKGFAFGPDGLEVDAGTTVTWTNEDDFAHTVTARDKSFDSKDIEKGGSFEHTFEKPGTYAYLCAIHNSMTATVTVA